MALQLVDRVQQTATANTTVSFSLTGTVLGFQAFSPSITTGNTTYYAATDTSGNWEAGIATLTSSTLLTRNTILSSSNSGSAVTFSGTVNVFVTYPSEKSVNQDASNNVTLPAQLLLSNQSLTATLAGGQLQIGPVTSFSDTGIVMSSVASTNSYFQNVIQNTNSGTAASAEFIAYNNNGTASTNFATVGINSSGYSGAGAINAPGYGYFLTGSTDLVLGTIGNNSMHFVVNSGTLDALTISSAGAVTTPNVLTGAELVASNGIVVNSNTVSASYSIPSGSSATSAGPMSLASGVSVTIPSGSRWVVL